MGVTRTQLDDFHRFVSTRVAAAPSEGLELEEYLRQWRSERERVEAAAEIRTAVAELEAGGGYTLEDADAVIRDRLAAQPGRRA